MTEPIATDPTEDVRLVLRHLGVATEALYQLQVALLRMMRTLEAQQTQALYQPPLTGPKKQ